MCDVTKRLLHTIERIPPEDADGRLSAIRATLADAIEEGVDSCIDDARAPGKFGRMGLELGQLVDRKQQAYGDSVGKTGPIMRILYPDGIPREAVDDALLMVRVLDKLNRMASNPSGDLMDESPWKDVAGYGLLGQAQHNTRKCVNKK